MLDSDANTAKTLTLVAIILQVVFFVIGIFAIAALAVVTTGITTTTSTGTTVTTSPPGIGVGIFGMVFGAIFLIGLLWILLDYFLIYKKLAEDKVEEAETPALILGIIQLLFGGIITGILLIVAYVKIKDSVRNRSNAAVAAPHNPVN
jgi:hypothetical protein